MKYITAILSGILIFVLVFILFGVLSAFILPQRWFETEINIGLLEANIPSLIALIIGAVAASHTFKASLSAKTKTARLYRKKTADKDRSN